MIMNIDTIIKNIINDVEKFHATALEKTERKNVKIRSLKYIKNNIIVNLEKIEDHVIESE